MAGAAADGATIFLVPQGNCAEAATGTDHGMTLVEMSTLDDAIEALQSLADDPGAEVPLCR
jgi:PDZ domain-containing protein